jgi:hypothetical protein
MAYRKPFAGCFLLSLICSLIFSFGAANAAEKGNFKPFVPIDPIMPLKSVKPGMTGECRTVIRGREVIPFPVEVLDVIPRSGSPKHLILIRASGKTMEETGGIASGMSGSPMYINGRLAGAIGYSWSFARHDTALVTPIEDMMDIWNYPERIPSFEPAPLVPEKPISPADADVPASSVSADKYETSPDLPPPGAASSDIPLSDDLADQLKEAPQTSSRDLTGYIYVGGLSSRMTERIGEILGMKVLPFGGGSNGQGPKRAKYGAKLKPGMAIGAALAWGDIEIGSIGTMTAVAEDGRFVAFAHPFINSGTTSAALMDADISTVISGVENPFKLGTTGDITGIITQDRPQGVGGRVGIFAPAASCTVNFKDVDAGRSFQRRFQMVQDKFLFSQIASTAIVGIVEDLWGRSGAGSAKITLAFTGGAISDGWKRNNIFVSEKNVANAMLEEFNLLTQIFAVNQFQELRPFGIEVTVEMTQDPRVIYVEDVKVPKGPFHPGERISFDITLRPWRRAPFVRTYSLVVPEKVSGICQLLVRGGGIAEEGAEYMEAGWRSISSLPILLREIDAKETNDQIVLELRGEEALEDRISKARNAEPEDLMNDKLNSEIKDEKMKNGSMRIIRTNYYVEGLIHKLIKVDNGGSGGAKPKPEPGGGDAPDPEEDTD